MILRAVMDERRLISAAEAAALIGLSVGQFYRRRGGLRKIGFPAPLPWNSRLYAREAIERWWRAALQSGVFHAPVDLAAADNVVVLPIARKIATERLRARGEARALERKQRHGDADRPDAPR